MPSSQKKFQFDMGYLNRMSDTIGDTPPGPDRDIWAETIAATGYNPDTAP
jgi:hypothetical protein